MVISPQSVFDANAFLVTELRNSFLCLS